MKENNLVCVYVSLFLLDGSIESPYLLGCNK